MEAYHIVHKEREFGYPVGTHRKKTFSMVVLSVDVPKGGDPLLIDRTINVNRSDIRPATREDYERFRISKPSASSHKAIRHHPLTIGERVFDVEEMRAGFITEIEPGGDKYDQDLIHLRADDEFNKRYMDQDTEMDSETWQTKESNVYQFVPGKVDRAGYPVCFEHNKTRDNYPYYSPVLDENQFSFEVEVENANN